MSEKNFRRRTKDGMYGVIAKPEILVCQVENSAGEGTPDTFWIIKGKCGWLELKCIEAFPKRPTTPVRVPHFRDCQRAWLHDYSMAGGICHVWLKVNKECFLLDGLESAMFLSRSSQAWTEADIRKKAILSFDNIVDWKAFVSCLEKN